MFIHWGIYSLLGDGEWVMQEHHLTGPQYEQLAAQFYPVKFDAAQWVALAKQAGMRYIVVTSRHHDGFSMFATKQNKYNVVDATPYGKDVIRQLADECHRQGIKLFVYYSQLDWHHPDYYPLGGTGRWDGRPSNGQWPRYLDFMNAQLTELFSNYGELGGVWFDGMWDKPDADWQLDRTYALIHQLQPGALIVSNHHKLPFPGEDYQTFEKDLPGDNTTGWGGAPIGQLPLETSDTMYRGGSWGFNLRDMEPKSLRDLVQYMVRAAGNNANFLLNVGPQPNGEIQTAFADRLREMGVVAEDLRRVDLRNSRRSGETRRMGSDHAARQHYLCARARSVAECVGAAGNRKARARRAPVERRSEGELSSRRGECGVAASETRGGGNRSGDRAGGGAVTGSTSVAVSRVPVFGSSSPSRLQ